MRKTSLNQVYEHALQDERIVFIGSDLGVGTLDEFKRDLPQRFFMEGVSEAHVIGMAAGLAMDGKIVYVNTIATFLTRRCFEQLVNDACLHNLPVRLIANGGGLVYAPLGPTHLATDDIAILRAIPNMTIVAPADAEEMKRLMPQTVNWPGPVYIRLAKGGDAVVSRADLPFEIGKAIEMRNGRDALLVTTGVTLQVALEAAERLAGAGIEAGILHMHTVKPLDGAAIFGRLADFRALITIEEHSITGGLGSAVAELLAESDAAVKFRRLGIPDVFPHQYGRQEDLMRTYGLTAENVAATVTELLA
jgi:transketolase